MIIETKLINENLNIILQGELDECSADVVRKSSDNAIVNNKFKSVTFDMADVRFMDSTGIGVLLGRYKLIKKLGIPIYITNCSNHIDKILSMSGIYNIIKKII